MSSEHDPRPQEIHPRGGVVNAIMRRLGGVPMAAPADRLREIHTLQREITSSPWSHDVLDLTMATATCWPFVEQDSTMPPWLLVTGAPSSDKTASVLLLKRAP